MRERVTTPVLWPGESHRQRSLAGYKEPDRTERLRLLLSRLAQTERIDTSSRQP